MNSATEKVLASLLLRCWPLVCVTGAGRSTEDLPVHRNRGHFFQNAKYMVVEMGSGHLYGDEEKQNKPRGLSSVLSSDSDTFSDLSKSSPHGPELPCVWKDRVRPNALEGPFQFLQ